MTWRHWRRRIWRDNKAAGNGREDNHHLLVDASSHGAAIAQRSYRRIRPCSWVFSLPKSHLGGARRWEKGGEDAYLAMEIIKKVLMQITDIDF